MSGTYLVLKKNNETSNHTGTLTSDTNQSPSVTMMQEMNQTQATVSHTTNEATMTSTQAYGIFFLGVIAVFSLVLALGKMRYRKRLLREKGFNDDTSSKKEIL